ncbi:pYEATS domain-containing protein [Tenacibaculum agarivorans]|uniref:pYEATS domain-containing protein n=1 Tax=Tenacibaculum agarivorans TaxID=1908389 RepID=UPI00094BA77E|nr:pYEATS domain-containing protein [Tenacibaculum agarivorans]
MSLKRRTYDIRVKDSIFNPHTNERKEGIAFFRKKGKTMFYKVNLYLEGNDLPFIKKVTYHLHKTFKNRERVIERTPGNFNCKLVLWTWGLFTVKIEIEDITGRKFHLTHYLTYGNEITKGQVKWKKE